MAEPEGTAGLDDKKEDSDVLDNVEERQELEETDQLEESDQLEASDESQDDEDGDGDDDEVAPPPRRRLVSELLEGQEAIEEAARADLQLVAAPIHAAPGESGQGIYQLDLSSDEPEGKIVEPEPVDPAESAEAAAASSVPGLDADGADVHATVKQLITHRDRQVMAAERDGIGAYELAAGIDHFVASLIDMIRRSNS